jgi:hypothetical protein
VFSDAGGAIVEIWANVDAWGGAGAFGAMPPACIPNTVRFIKISFRPSWTCNMWLIQSSGTWYVARTNLEFTK